MLCAWTRIVAWGLAVVAFGCSSEVPSGESKQAAPCSMGQERLTFWAPTGLGLPVQVAAVSRATQGSGTARLEVELRSGGVWVGEAGSSDRSNLPIEGVPIAIATSVTGESALVATARTFGESSVTEYIFYSMVRTNGSYLLRERLRLPVESSYLHAPSTPKLIGISIFCGTDRYCIVLEQFGYGVQDYCNLELWVMDAKSGEVTAKLRGAPPVVRDDFEFLSTEVWAVSESSSRKRAFLIVRTMGASVAGSWKSDLWILGFDEELRYTNHSLFADEKGQAHLFGEDPARCGPSELFRYIDEDVIRVDYCVESDLLGVSVSRQ